MNTVRPTSLFVTMLLIAVCPQMSQGQGIQKDSERQTRTTDSTPAGDAKTGTSTVEAPPFQASLLLVTADWSKVPAAAAIEKELRAVLQDVELPREQVEKLPATGTDVLFAPGMIGFYTSEHYAQFYEWLNSKQLIRQTIPFTAAKLVHAGDEAAAVQSSAEVPSSTTSYPSPMPTTFESHLRQPSDFFGLPPHPQVKNSTFVTRQSAITWDVSVNKAQSRIVLQREFLILEMARGQSEARVSSKLGSTPFIFRYSEPGIAIMNAFYVPKEAPLREAARAKGFDVLLVIDTTSKPIDPATTKPQLHLPDKVDTVRDGTPALSWPMPRQTSSVAGTGLESSSSASQLEPEQISVLNLQNSRASATAELLRQVFDGQSAAITADQRANTIVVRARREIVDEIKALVLRLDELTEEKEGSDKISSGSSNTGGSFSQGQTATRTQKTIADLKREYDQKEQQASATARQLLQLRGKGSPESREGSKLESQLRKEVADAFAARQDLHQAEVASLQQRIGQLQQTMSARSRIQDQIIDRRVQDLLNPNLAWDSDSTTSPVQDKYGEKVRTGGTSSTGSSPYGSSSAVTTRDSTVRGTPLSDAVRAFNVANENHPDGKDQPPLTDDDVVAAIRWSVSTSDRRKIPDADANILEAIAESRVLPDNAQLELGTRFDLPDGSKLTKWTISVTLHHADGTGYQHLIREQLVSWKPAPGAVKASPDSDLNLTRPKDTPLAAAIHGFNEKHSGDRIGKDQPPLTEDEVIAAIRWYKTKRNEADLTNEEFQAFQEIADKGVLPDKVEFEVLTGFQPNDRFRFDAWSVRIVMPRLSKKGWTYGFTIRDRWINSERLAERQISWGTVAPNGFQAGILIKPQSEQYAEGQQIVPLFVFRNTGKQTLEVAFPNLMTHGYYHALRVVDSTGRDIEVDQDPGPGGPVGWLQIELAPGSEHVISGIPIALGNVSRESGVETVVKAKPGQSCRLRFSVPNFSERNSKPIETGEIRFTMGPKS